MAVPAKSSSKPVNTELKDRNAHEEASSASLATVLMAIEDRVIRGGLEKNAALIEITEAITKLPAIEGAMIALSSGAEMVCCASSGTAPQIGSRISALSGLCGACFSSGRMVRSDDALVDPRVDVAAGDRRFGSVVILPLASKGSSRGVLAVFAPPHGISSEHTTAFGTAATLASLLAAELKTIVTELAVQPESTPANQVPPPAGAASSSWELPPAKALHRTRAEVSLMDAIRQSEEARLQAGEPSEEDELPTGRTPLWRKGAILAVLILALSGLLLLARFYLARQSSKTVHAAVVSSPQAHLSPAVTEIAGSPTLINTKRATGVMTGGALIQRQPSVYPPSAISNGVEGDVSAVLVVAETGVVNEVQISSGDATLAHSASAALAHWRYAPFKADGQSVSVKVPVRVSFRLVKPAS